MQGGYLEYMGQSKAHQSGSRPVRSILARERCARWGSLRDPVSTGLAGRLGAAEVDSDSLVMSVQGPGTCQILSCRPDLPSGPYPPRVAALAPRRSGRVLGSG